MLYNEAFILGLSEEAIEVVVQHEVLHCALGHIFMKNWDFLKNIAGDLAINSHLSKSGVLAAGGLYPGEGMFKDFPIGKSLEYYARLIQENPDKYKGVGDGFDSHDFEPPDDALPSNAKGDKASEGNGEGFSDTETDEQYVKRIAKDSFKKAANDNAWGNVSAELRGQLEEYFTGTYNWEAHLRHLTLKVRSTVIGFSRKRINKRFGMMYPGVIREYKPRIAIGVDESGSVSDLTWRLFAETLASLSKYATFTLVPFDCQVQSNGIKQFKHGEKFKWARTSVGGTNFNCITNWFNERSTEYDALFILTDGQAEAPELCKRKRFWVLSDNDKMYFETSEEVIKIKTN